MDTDNIQQEILRAISKNISYTTCDDICKKTGLTLSAIFPALETLLHEKKISITVLPCYYTSSGTYSPRSKQIFTKFNALLDEYIHQERSITFYASKLFITAKYLSRIVKYNSGQSAKHWIDKRLFEIVKFQLLHTSKSIKEIAYGLNFPDLSTFGKYVKSQTNVSPSSYRMSHSI